MTMRIARAGVADAADAVAILREAAEWSAGVGERTWDPSIFTRPAWEAFALAGELVGGWEGEVMAATMLLQPRDPTYWPDDAPGDALYLHKVAVRRSAAGRGWSRALVEWAAGEARAAGVPHLRLDTLAEGPLPALYERLGFRVVDRTLVIGGRRFARMERRV